MAKSKLAIRITNLRKMLRCTVQHGLCALSLAGFFSIPALAKQAVVDGLTIEETPVNDTLNLNGVSQTKSVSVEDGVVVLSGEEPQHKSRIKEAKKKSLKPNNTIAEEKAAAPTPKPNITAIKKPEPVIETPFLTSHVAHAVKKIEPAATPPVTKPKMAEVVKKPEPVTAAPSAKPHTTEAIKKPEPVATPPVTKPKMAEDVKKPEPVTAAPSAKPHTTEAIKKPEPVATPPVTKPKMAEVVKKPEPVTAAPSAKPHTTEAIKKPEPVATPPVTNPKMAEDIKKPESTVAVPVVKSQVTEAIKKTKAVIQPETTQTPNTKKVLLPLHPYFGIISEAIHYAHNDISILYQPEISIAYIEWPIVPPVPERPFNGNLTRFMAMDSKNILIHVIASTSALNQTQDALTEMIQLEPNTTAVFASSGGFLSKNHHLNFIVVEPPVAKVTAVKAEKILPVTTSPNLRQAKALVPAKRVVTTQPSVSHAEPIIVKSTPADTTPANKPQNNLIRSALMTPVFLPRDFFHIDIRNKRQSLQENNSAAEVFFLTEHPSIIKTWQSTIPTYLLADKNIIEAPRFIPPTSPKKDVVVKKVKPPVNVVRHTTPISEPTEPTSHSKDVIVRVTGGHQNPTGAYTSEDINSASEVEDYSAFDRTNEKDIRIEGSH